MMRQSIFAKLSACMLTITVSALVNVSAFAADECRTLEAMAAIAQNASKHDVLGTKPGMLAL
jgi:hypothetical protein